ncbi:MAG: T9SS type A sorting domain-containing protein [Chitinophagales bacterium]
MKNFKSITLILFLLFSFGSMSAQVTLYVDSLKMDVYTPDGDTSTNRPLILLSHAGSYLPPSLTNAPFGTKSDSFLVEMCTQFAKRGFVAVAFTYRLGWNPQAPDQETRASTIIQAVYKASHDSKALIRYFRKNAATYNVDTDKIILGGSNSGAYHALLAANLNRPEELSVFKFLDSNGDPYIDTTLWGNFDGENGALSYYNHPGYSSEFDIVLSLGGDVGDTSWVDPGETPVIAFHGVNDASPYETAVVTTGANQIAIIEVSGPGDFMPYVNQYGNNDVFSGGGFCPGPQSTDGVVYEGNYPFYGANAGFEPYNWYATNPPNNPTASKSRALAYIDTIMDYSIPRIYKAFFDNNYMDACPQTGGVLTEDFNNVNVQRNVTYAWNWSIFPTAEDTSGTVVGANGINDPINDQTISMNIYPNPAHSTIRVELNDNIHTIQSVELYDVAGKLLRQENVGNLSQYTLNRNGESTGIYFLSVTLSNGKSGFKRVVFE